MLGGTNDGILKIAEVDTVMPLSDPAIKNAKSTEKPYKMPDEKGMYLLVNPNGGKYFILLLLLPPLLSMFEKCE